MEDFKGKVLLLQLGILFAAMGWITPQTWEQEELESQNVDIKLNTHDLPSLHLK